MSGLASYTRNPVQIDEINTAGHIFADVVWEINGSKSNVYDIQLLDRGMTCTCPQFAFKGKRCKHIDQVINLITGE